MKKLLPFILPIFRSVLLIIVSIVASIITNQSLENISRWWSLLCILSNLITIFVVCLICKYEKIRFRDLINFSKGQNSIKTTLVIVIFMLVLGMGGMYGFGFLIFGYVPVIMIQTMPIWAAIIALILLPITIVFAEMPLYMGYCIPRIDKLTGNKYVAIIYPMFFYALQHSFMPLLLDWKHMTFRFLSFLPLMLVIGFWYYKNRKLTQLMIGHGVLDIATGIQLMITAIYPNVYEIMSSAIK